jgi:hypothetical protein
MTLHLLRQEMLPAYVHLICFYYNGETTEQHKLTLAVFNTWIDNTRLKSTNARIIHGSSVIRIVTTYCNVLGVLYSRWNFIALQKSIHYS